MKRSPRTVFDDSGNKWYQSPLYKEGFFLITSLNFPAKLDGTDMDGSFKLREDYMGGVDPSKVVRDKFYDFFSKVTKNGEPRIDKEELNRSLTVKIDDLPDSMKASEMFERLNSKVCQNSKGKKNWSEEETALFIWIILCYCELNNTDYQDLVTLFSKMFKTSGRLRLGLHSQYHSWQEIGSVQS
jgi:hypothetical protein